MKTNPESIVVEYILQVIVEYAFSPSPFTVKMVANVYNHHPNGKITKCRYKSQETSGINIVLVVSWSFGV